jgi:hypothetical protein
MTIDRSPETTAGVARAALIWASLVAACSATGGGPASGPLADEGPTVGQSGSEGVPTVGQSGSEGVPSGGGVTVPCPCGLGRSEALRVTVLAKKGDRVSLRVEEVLHGTAPVTLGDVIDASWYDDKLPCYLGCYSVEVGEQALAFYTPGEPALPACAARDACVAACEAENLANEGEVSHPQCVCREAPAMTTWGSTWESPPCGVYVVDGGGTCRKECEQETAESCPPRPEQDNKRGLVLLSPWADPIVFARGERGELSIPRDQLGELFTFSGDLDTCRERFGDWSDYLRPGGW